MMCERDRGEKINAFSRCVPFFNTDWEKEQGWRGMGGGDEGAWGRYARGE